MRYSHNQQRHARLERHGIHHAARQENLRTWISDAHPDALTGLNLTATPTGYLADLYPNLWQHGPRGNTYHTQLARITAILDSDDRFDFINYSRHALNSVDAVYDDPAIIPALYGNAATNGTPHPAEAILYGMDYPHNPASCPTATHLTKTHPLWRTHDDYRIDFGEYLTRFSLLSIHNTFLSYLPSPKVTTALHTYNMGCDRWGIPR